MKLETIKAIQLIGDKMTPEEIVEAFDLGTSTEIEVQEPGPAESRQFGEWRADEDEKLIELYRQGMPHKKIGRKLKRTDGSVNKRLQILRKAGKIDTYKFGKKRVWTTKEIEEIKTMLFKYKRPKDLLKRSAWIKGFKERTGRTDSAIVSRVYEVYNVLLNEGKIPE